MTQATARPSSLEGAAPEDVIRWAVSSFGSAVAMSCSFQSQSLPLLHMVSAIAPRLPVIFLDTGYHFPETLAFRDRLVAEWGLNLQVARALPQAVSRQPSTTELYLRDPDRCCMINKVEPMQRAMQGLRAWISGIRRDQSDLRANVGVVEDGANGLIRVHPLAAWTGRDIWKYIHDHDLPEHPLVAKGYLSVGCAPCTRPAGPGGERAGRWQGTDKTECGLHTVLRPSSNPPESQ